MAELLHVGLETALRDLLITNKNSSAVAQDLLNRVENKKNSKKELYSFIHFAFHAGLHVECLRIFKHLFSDLRPIPWLAFFEILRRSGFKPGPDFINEFFKAIDKNEEAFDYYAPWNKYDSRFQECFNKELSKIQNTSSKEKDKLYKKLEYFHENRMIGEESLLLNDLIRRFPEDETLIVKKNNLDKNWANEFIARTFQSYDEAKYSHQNLLANNSEHHDLLQLIASDIQARFSSNTHVQYYLAIGLYFMEGYRYALQVLGSPSELAAQWLQVELQLIGRKYLEGLDQLAKIEVENSADPESTFAVTYLRAQFLKALGHDTSAIGLMQSIVSVRPTYRNATTLINSWARN